MFKTIDEEVVTLTATAEAYQNRASQAFAKGDIEKSTQLMGIAIEARRTIERLAPM